MSHFLYLERFSSGYSDSNRASLAGGSQKGLGARLRRGQTLVEFALLLPVLLVLVLGMVQYGIVANKRLALSHTSRDGGRFAAVNALKPDIDNEIKQRIINMGRGHGLTLTAADISLSPTQNTATEPTKRQQYNALTVVISLNMKPHLFLPSRFFGFSLFADTASTSTQVIME